MTYQAQQAVANAIALEVKKDGLRQTQSGEWCLSLKVSAVDMDSRLTQAGMGTRYQCVLVEINDDETPRDHKGEERQKWHNLGPTRQAGMRCNDPVFWGFLNEECGYGAENEQDATEAVHEICGVASRKDLNSPVHLEARQKWRDLDNHYQAWKAAEHG